MQSNTIRIFGAKDGEPTNARTADYTDDRGEITGELRHITYTLPSPDHLVPRDDTVKVTLALSRRSVEFFKHEAARQRVPCQRMIRALVDECTRRMR